jgi:parallel beta-helix repeat protein
MKMRPILVVVLIIASTILPATADHFYVSSAGSDSNPGTQAEPFATIQHGINACPAYPTLSTVHLDASLWYESPDMFLKNVTLVGDYNGPNGLGGRTTSRINGIISTNGQPYYFLNQKIKYLTVNEISFSVCYSLIIDSCDITYSAADGITFGMGGWCVALTITNCLIAYCNGHGIYSDSSQLYLTFENNTIHNCSGSGIYASDGLEGCYINNNTIYDCDQSGIVVDGNGNLIYDNNIHNNSGYGIEFTDDTSKVYDNIIENNQSYGIYCTGSNCNPDLGGGAQSSTGNNTILGNGTYEVYNDSPNLIFAKYNYWDPLSSAEMAGHTYLEVDVTRIFDHWDDTSKGYVDWDDPGTHTKVVPTSLGQIKASYR